MLTVPQAHLLLTHTHCPRKFSTRARLEGLQEHTHISGQTGESKWLSLGHFAKTRSPGLQLKSYRFLFNIHLNIFKPETQTSTILIKLDYSTSLLTSGSKKTELLEQEEETADWWRADRHNWKLDGKHCLAAKSADLCWWPSVATTVSVKWY